MQNEPTTLILFGATGDLVKKKVAPALYELFLEHKLPASFRVIGMAFSPHTDESFRTYIASLLGDAQAESVAAFTALWSYHQGDFNMPEAYLGLKERVTASDTALGLCTHKLFFFSVTPKFYEPIFTHSAGVGLTESCGVSWARLLIEKPLGHNSQTAQELNNLLGKLFKEEQLFRIEHYLAKDMVQAIAPFRFGNPMLAWNKEAIQSVHVSLLESIDVSGRGAFYETVGALRDVGQNHLLQMLALVAMEAPQEWTPEGVQSARSDILEKLQLLTPDEVRTQTFRAQYDGYRNVADVQPNSVVETYYRAVATIDDPRWAGVPFIMESGKALGESVKEIRIRYKRGVYPSCDDMAPPPELIIHIEPKEEITVRFSAHKAGAMVCGSMQEVHIPLEHQHGGIKIQRQYIDEYKKIFRDCMAGDRSAFVSAREVAAMWRWVDPIIDAWSEDVVPLETYTPGTKDIITKAESNIHI